MLRKLLEGCREVTGKILYRNQHEHGSEHSSILVHNLLSMHSIDKFIYKKISESHFVDVEVPKVFGLSGGGRVRLRHEAVNIYRFSNAMVESKSDMVVIDAGAIWPKASLVTINMEVPTDRNLVSFDLGHHKVAVKSRASSIKVEKAFSLLGGAAFSWSHFLVEVLPKVVLLNQLDHKEGLKVLVPDGVDEHVRAILGDCLREMPYVEVMYVPESVAVICNELYWCSPVAYICGHADYTHLAAVIIPEMTRTILAEFFGKYGDLNNSQGIKIYIDREGDRNIENGNEIKSLFESAGYKVVVPHMMTFEEKVNIFSNATHIAGPASSGFANIFFSKRKTKVLWFVNFERCLDTYFSQLLSRFPNISHWTLVGARVGNTGINSNYMLEFDQLKRFLIETRFDAELLKCFQEGKVQSSSIINNVRCGLDG